MKTTTYPGRLLLAPLSLITLLAISPASFATLNYDFDDGTLQGWTTILPADPGAAPLAFTSTTAPISRVQPQAGTNLLAPMPWNGRDLDHETLYVRSPEFFVDTSGDLTFYMAGGSASSSLPATDADVLATPNAMSGGAMFVGLRRVSDGTFVLTKRRGGNGNGWVAHSFTAAELAPFVGERCTLDLVDTNVSGWGWTALDTVSIPGVSGASVVITQNTFLTTATTGDTVGDLSSVGGTDGDSHAFTFVTGEGSTDNDKFTISGTELQLGAFDFSSAADGTEYSVRLQSTGTPSNEVIETILTLTVETPYEPRLVGFWDFNEGNAGPGAGGIKDLAGDDGQHDGTMTGGLLSTDVPAALAGAGSRSLDLTGGNSHVVIDTFLGDAQDNDFNALKAPAMSISLWVKGWPSGNWTPFVAKNGEDAGWQIRRQGGNQTGTFTLRGTSAADDPATNSDIGPNPGWSHLVGTYDGTVRKMYVNGVEFLSVEDSGAISPTADLVVFGNRMTGGSIQSTYSNVQMDDIGIWNYALSLDEIQELATGVSPVEGGPGAAFEIVEFEQVSPGIIRLTWTAKANESYNVNFSADLIDWTGELADNITLADDEAAGDGNLLTMTFDLNQSGLGGAERLYFRVSR